MIYTSIVTHTNKRSLDFPLTLKQMLSLWFINIFLMKTTTLKQTKSRQVTPASLHCLCVQLNYFAKQRWGRWASYLTPCAQTTFPSEEMTHCLLWFSLMHPAPLGLDDMVQTGPRLLLYVPSPIVLLPGVRLLLVPPFWMAQAWFTDLLSLLYGSPWEICLRSDLLSQAGGTIYHPLMDMW